MIGQFFKDEAMRNKSKAILVVFFGAMAQCEAKTKAKAMQGLNSSIAFA